MMFSFVIGNRMRCRLLIAVIAVMIPCSSMAMGVEGANQSLPSSEIRLEGTSAPQVHDFAGQIIRIEGRITNTGETGNSGGIAYITIVDLIDKVPVDLEDWSAEKGLYIPSIEPGQSLPLEWNVRLVKAGTYTISILFNRDSELGAPPVASTKIFLEVKPKFNLNPENILPVAFGVPAGLIAILGSVNYYRGRKLGIYD